MDGYREAAEDILAVIQADPLAYVKPKPLEWVEDESNTKTRYGAGAESAFGEYSITSSYANPFYNVEIGVVIEDEGEEVIWDYKRISHNKERTLEAAQAAAYEDLCNRVKELF